METPSSDTVHIPGGFDLHGHRGARGLRPENTLVAFRHALELGVSTLEMDVVVSADQQVVVSHDPWMDPTICTAPNGKPIKENEGPAHNIFDMPVEKVKQYDCGRRPHPDFPGQTPVPATKPLLREVVQMAEAFERSRPVFYNVEIKSRPDWEGTYHPDPDTFAGLVYDTMAAAGVQARTILQSFDPRILQALHAQSSPVRLALLVSPSYDFGLGQNLEWLGFEPAIYAPEERLVDRALVEAVHERGMQIIPWTVNERAAMERLAAWGVDGLITDYPDRGQFLLV